MRFVISFVIDLGGLKQNEPAVPTPRGGMAEASVN